MTEWIPFEEGMYRVERAVLLGTGENGVEMEDTVIEVRKDPRGGRRLRGRGRVRNLLLVQLLDEGEDPDLLLDLGGVFKYRLTRPEIQGGKVFAPGIRSFIQFLPRQPWKQVPEAEFNSLMSRVRILSDEPG
jgi:hypothetical protein